MDGQKVLDELLDLYRTTSPRTEGRDICSKAIVIVKDNMESDAFEPGLTYNQSEIWRKENFQAILGYNADYFVRKGYIVKTFTMKNGRKVIHNLIKNSDGTVKVS
jgi:hypothetical protein